MPPGEKEDKQKDRNTLSAFLFSVWEKFTYSLFFRYGTVVEKTKEEKGNTNNNSTGVHNKSKQMTLLHNFDLKKRSVTRSITKKQGLLKIQKFRST